MTKTDSEPMPLDVGTHLGPYQVVAAIGAGGMGEVYRARDTRLNRDVAVKILPEPLAADPERLARFEREAQALAALNHPNIAQIYGVEESGGTRALVMEFVDGPDLAQRLSRGAIAFEEVIAIARQIGDALEAAHERGIVHRDLKPANIKLDPDGIVKVLDFGLAKAMDPAASPGIGLAHSPTFTAATAVGVILGTAAYMSPEQARGKPADRRADIWAFGVVLFEMLAGRPLYAGETATEVLAAVIKEEPTWDALPTTIPPGVWRVLRLCLRKDPRRRLRDIGDARLLLDEPSESGTLAREPGRLGRLLPWTLAVAAVLIAVASIVTGRRAAPADPGVTRFVLQPPPGTVPADPVLSRDGRFLVYRAGRVYVHRLAELAPRALQGTEHAAQVFLSPDDRWIGFYADGRLKKVSIDGGDPLTICDVDPDSPGASWVSGNRILFTSGWNDTPLSIVSADGGTPVPASTLDREQRERGHWWPAPMPDGRHVLFTIWYAASGLNESRVGLLDLQSGTHRTLFAGAMPRYAAGRILYYHAGGYHLIDFDPHTLSTKGESRRVLSDAIGLDPQGSPDKPVSVAANGTIAYLAGELFPEAEVAWIARTGVETPTNRRIRPYRAGDLSPDGHRLAIAVAEGGGAKLWIFDLLAGSELRLDAPGANRHPVWYPDATRLAFVSTQKGDFDVLVQKLDGSPAEPLMTSDLDESPVSWSPDGRQLLVQVWRPDGSTTLTAVDVGNSRQTTFVSGPFEKGDARISVDGRWLAYAAAPTGRWFLYVRRMSANGPTQQVASSATAGSLGAIRWSPRTKELYYLRESNLVALRYDDRDGRFAVMKEEAIASLPVGTQLFGVSPDGLRLLVGKPVGTTSAPTSIRVVLNGLDEKP